MRRIGGSVCYIRSAIRHQKCGYWSTFVRRPKYLIDNNPGCGYGLTSNAQIHRILPPSLMLSRALSTDAAANATIADMNKAGPLVEYERRIAAGELVDGDICQLGSLRELQRLYDELVESADACQLDRYSSSEKAGRSRWLWSRFLPQSSYSPVKGLYLYGGVGTGKTMLMDLFYDQLPADWRKKRIHFHDFMLNVHSRLQKHKGLADPLEIVAGEISDEAILLCLDEFIVTDVADALILNRLFGHLFSNGVWWRLVVVLREKTYIYDANTLDILNTIETRPNPKGLCAFSPSLDSCFLALPTRTTKGSVLEYNVMELHSHCEIDAHRSPFVAIVFSSNGMYVARASEQGTIIRVFLVP